MIPPGKYISSRSRPTPEVSSRTSSLAPKMAGMPFTQSTPNSGPAIDPSPPMMAMAMTLTDSLALNSTWGFMVGSPVMISPPPKAARPPASVNEMSLIRLPDTVDAAAMSSLSRTAIIIRPIPVLRR